MKLDPRVKLASVIFVTTISIIKEDILTLILTLFLSIIVSIIVKSNIIRRIMVMKRLFLTFLGIFLIQCIFNRGGDPILIIGGYAIIYEQGFVMGIGFILRMSIILICGGILLTSSSRDMIQGLVQMKVPYELAFMVTIAIGFIPLLGEEIKNTLIALNLRGINISSLPFRARIKGIGNLFIPTVVNTLERSKELSLSLEFRSFRLNRHRSSYYTLVLIWRDYLMLVSVGIISILIYIVV